MPEATKKVLREDASEGADSLRAQLLVGDRASGPPAADELFRFRFGGVATDSSLDHVFDIATPPVSGEEAAEAWHCAGDICRGRDGTLRYAYGDDFLAVHLFCHETGDDELGENVCQAYLRLAGHCRGFGYPHLLRIWNFIPEINRGGGDQERYRRFSVGRGQAFDALDLTTDELPAGTAIGTAANTPLTITVLASRSPHPMLANPRQVNAYEYPRQYGPRSPSFARAVAIRRDPGAQLLVSGTASIVGHESRHPNDLQQQAIETCANIGHLIRNSDIEALNNAAQRIINMRIYLRRTEDADAVKTVHSSTFGEAAQILCLRGDICRQELLLETEALICAATRSSV